MQSTAAYTIASGPNPVVNALDMIVLATLSRMVVEDYEVGSVRRRARRHCSKCTAIWSGKPGR